MAKKERSIRGEVVDFDLLTAKAKIEGRKKPDSVEMREKYVDIRRRRNPRRSVAELVDEQRQNEQDARERIAQSKKAKELAVEEPVVVEVDQEDEAPVSTPAATKTTTKKKVVKKKT